METDEADKLVSVEKGSFQRLLFVLFVFFGPSLMMVRSIESRLQMKKIIKMVL